MNLTEEHAFEVLREARVKFGWTGVIYTRMDVDDIAETELTDEQWEKVRYSWAWRKGLRDPSDHDWDMIMDALNEAGVDTY